MAHIYIMHSIYIMIVFVSAASFSSVLAIAVAIITGLFIFFVLVTTVIVTAVQHDREHNKTIYNSTNGTSFM